MYGLKDIKHLEVMTNLLNTEPKNQAQVKLKPLLAFKEPRELTVSEKILSLCEKLRLNGFEKQASNLEQKFLSYKTASTHLYRAIDEDGEDLIDFAHPDGDSKVEDASNEFGVVETIVTQHKKIVDKVQKQPTGKFASYLNQVEAVLEKKAFHPLLLALWSKTNRLNQGVEKNTDILLAEIDDIDKSKEIKQSIEGVELINSVQKHLNELKQMTAIYRKILNPTEKDMEFILKYHTFVVNIVEPELKSLNNVMGNIRHNMDESTILPSIYRTFVASDFEDVQKAIAGLWKALLELTAAIVDMNTQFKAHQKNKKTQETDSFLLNYDPNIDNETNKVENTKQPVTLEKNLVGLKEEVEKLNNWKAAFSKKQMEQARKDHITKWIDGQIKELNEAKTQEEVNKIIEQNKKFEAKGLI